MKAKLMIGLVLCFLCSIGVSYAKKKSTDSETATRIVTAAYQELLGRKPDEEGLKKFRSLMVDQGWDEGGVRDALKKSEEYLKVNAERIIVNAYKDILGRGPDDTGRKLYIEKITKEGWDEKGVRKALMESPEYKNKNKKK
jgi:hypothetical protein